MLHTLQQHHLGRILFPLGGLTKVQTRQLARGFQLPVANKPDSQEICFVAGKDYKRFLHDYAGDIERPGDIVDAHGHVLGRHRGLHEFTIGQRKGLGVAAHGPHYVIELRPTQNQVVIGDRDDASGVGVTCSQLSFTGRRPAEAFSASVKIRYRAPERPGTVRLQAGPTARVDFDQPMWGAAPGQFAVFYDHDRVVGGGTIDEVIRAA